jgi:hypothetical protein
MDYLLEDAVEFFDDFLPRVEWDAAPDLRGRRGHDSFSFTKASRSRTAAAVSLERTEIPAKADKLVDC